MERSAFIQEARAFLDTHSSRRAVEETSFAWGDGDDSVALFDSTDREIEYAELERSKNWRRLRFDAGLGWLSGPPQYGGRGLSTEHEKIYADLEKEYDVPNDAFFKVSLGMVAPTIFACGQTGTKERLLAALYRGDLIGCQLFSEPGAGSDLASVGTRAVADGDSWRITGQKVWTSGAHYSDIGEILCRTRSDVPKHRGITAFVVDMHAPGVVVRPLRQMTGGASFNEVFFDDVRVSDSDRLGDLDGGWSVALTTLMTERASIGNSGAAVGGGFDKTAFLAKMLHHYGLHNDQLLRHELMRIHINTTVADLNNQRANERAAAGHAPGPEMSIAKLTMTQNMWSTAQFVAKVLGPRIIADTGRWSTYTWASYLLDIPGVRVAGGTDEVMRNILAERVLGLPKEPSVHTGSG